MIAVAWYRRDQWERLRELAADPEKLEPTYDEWLEMAQRKLMEIDPLSRRWVRSRRRWQLCRGMAGRTSSPVSSVSTIRRCRPVSNPT